MRHFETHEPALRSGTGQIPPTQPKSRAAGTDITAVRDKAHALMAGQLSLLTAPTFELRAGDARRYRIQLNGSGRVVDITRQNSQALTALREITVPLNRPIVVLIEHGEDFDSEDSNEIASMAGIGRDVPTLCPGSLILLGTDKVYWV